MDDVVVRYAAPSGRIAGVEDPLGWDCDEDVVVTTTRRAISRVAFVAAETASRFEREMIGHDPMAWMMAPLRLFDGAAALDACLRRENFLRASLLHGLSIDLDAYPDEIDDLLDDDEGDDDDGSDGGADCQAFEVVVPTKASVLRDNAESSRAIRRAEPDGLLQAAPCRAAFATIEAGHSPRKRRSSEFPSAQANGPFTVAKSSNVSNWSPWGVSLGLSKWARRRAA